MKLIHNLLISILFMSLAWAEPGSDFGQNDLQQAAQGAAPTTDLLSSIDFKKFRDPFKAPESKPVEDLKTALERFSVNEFKLIAVMTGPVRMRALIADPSGKTYTVSKNMPIGLRDGKVIKITTQSVLVREKLVNPLGELENVDTEIGFAEKSETK